MSDVKHFNNDNFETEVVKSDVPVLIDFFATWCGPCKMAGPIVEDLAREYAGKVKIGKLDVDEAGDVAAKFQVRGVPTFMIFKGGQKVWQQVGLVPKEKFQEELKKLL